MSATAPAAIASLHAPHLLLGEVWHRRLRPAVNAFTYPLFFVELPLRHLQAARSPMFALNRPHLLSFYDRDHGPRDGSPLLPWIERILNDAGVNAEGEIVLQTFPRVLGYLFNPVSFWYCHDRDGELIAVLAEVNNTFGGRHHYLLHQRGTPLTDGVELGADKVFHVSPFNRVEGGYRFRFVRDERATRAEIHYSDGDGELLQTAISGRRCGWSAATLAGALLRMPLLTLGVVWRIHWQALRLWRKGVPFYGAKPPSPAPEPLHTAPIIPPNSPLHEESRP